MTTLLSFRLFYCHSELLFVILSEAKNLLSIQRQATVILSEAKNLFKK